MGRGEEEPAKQQSHLCFLTGDRDLSCLQVTEAGSGLPFGEGLSFLWALDGGKEQNMGCRKGREWGSPVHSGLRALRGQCPETASQVCNRPLCLLPLRLSASSSGVFQGP